MVKASDVDWERTNVKLMDEGSTQTSAEDQTPQDVQGTQDDESSDVGLARTGTGLMEDSVHSGSTEFEADDGA